MQSRRINPVNAHFFATIKTEINCDENLKFPNRTNRIDCEKYSQMVYRLTPIAWAYFLNQEKIKEIEKLEKYAHNDCMHFQDHSMSTVICNWVSMYNQQRQSLMKEQEKIEEESWEIFNKKS